MRPLRDFEEFSELIASFTNYERMSAYSYDSETLGIERMRSFARELGDPQRRYPSVHIAGTKGKGATTLLLEALLRAHGLLIGTYTSPHLVHMVERIRVDARSITLERLVELTNRALPILARRESDPRERPTYFELMTGLAMLEFAEREVDTAIFEVGLGGRLDATNIVDSSWTAITSIGLEHTKLLGDTLAEIAREKAGIVKPGTPLVLGPLPAEAREAAISIAREKGSDVSEVDPDVVRRISSGVVGIDGISRPLVAPCVRGPALRTDLAIAWTLARRVLEDSGHEIDDARVEHALCELRLPARVELFEGDPPVCLDGAHTPESFEALANTLDEESFPRPRTLIFSIARDKTLDPILEILPRVADRVILTLADTTRSTLPTDLQQRLPDAELRRDPHDALDRALSIGDPIVVAGSIYLAGALRPRLLKAIASHEECPSEELSPPSGRE